MVVKPFCFVGNYVLNKIIITYVSYGQDLILAVANVQSAVKSLIMVQFNNTFFCFVGNHMQNNINVTDARYGQDLISAVANVQSAVKSLIMVEFN